VGEQLEFQNFFLDDMNSASDLRLLQFQFFPENVGAIAAQGSPVTKAIEKSL